MEALDAAAPFATYWPRATRLLERVENVAMAIVASALFATMMITVVDVVMRYGFNAPLAFAYDFIGQYLLVAAFFLALSYTLRVHGHMNVDILPLALKSERQRAALRSIGDALALVLFIALLWASAATAWDAWTSGEVAATALSLPIWISRGFVPLGTALLVMRLFLHLAGDVRFLADTPKRPARAAR